MDVIIDCFPETCPCCARSDIEIQRGPYYRHQVFGTTFSVGAISEAQMKVASVLTSLHKAIKQALKKAPLIHFDETSHH